MGRKNPAAEDGNSYPSPLGNSYWATVKSWSQQPQNDGVKNAKVASVGTKFRYLSFDA